MKAEEEREGEGGCRLRAIEIFRCQSVHAGAKSAHTFILAGVMGDWPVKVAVEWGEVSDHGH